MVDLHLLFRESYIRHGREIKPVITHFTSVYIKRRDVLIGAMNAETKEKTEFMTGRISLAIITI